VTTLREAREHGKLDQFIKEREAEAAPKGDANAFNRGLRSMARTSSEAPKASSRGNRGG
jgi:hypothetical protein